jgi:hypothetical protein
MLSLVNIPIGALLGVILANSPVFVVSRIADLPRAFHFVLFVLFQAINIRLAIIRLSRKDYEFFVVFVFLYFGVEIAIWLTYAFDDALNISGNLFSYTWLFVVTTSLWFCANVGAAVFDDRF